MADKKNQGYFAFKTNRNPEILATRMHTGYPDPSSTEQLAVNNC